MLRCTYPVQKNMNVEKRHWAASMCCIVFCICTHYLSAYCIPSCRCVKCKRLTFKILNIQQSTLDHEILVK